MTNPDPPPVPLPAPNWDLLEEEATTFADRLTSAGFHYQAWQVREIRDMLAQRRDKERGHGPWRTSA